MASATMESRDVKNTFTDVTGTMQLVSFTLGKELYGVIGGEVVHVINTVDK